MPTGNLDTTNLLLGIMAAVSVLEALLLIVIGVMAYRLFTKATQTVQDLERRQIAPLVANVQGLIATVHGVIPKVDGIIVDVKAVLADVKGVTTRVGQQTERVDTAIRDTIDKVDETAERVRSSVASRVSRVLALVHSVSGAVERLRHHGRSAPAEQRRPA